MPLSIEDNRRFGDLFEERYTAMVFYAFKILNDEEEAKDAVMEAFYKVGKYGMGGGDINRQVLFFAVKNTCFDLLRRRVSNRNKLDVLLDRLIQKGEDHVIEAEALGLVYDRLNKLPKRQKSVIALYIEGFSFVDIAYQMKTNAGNVRALKDAAIQTLRKFVKERKLSTH